MQTQQGSALPQEKFSRARYADRTRSGLGLGLDGKGEGDEAEPRGLSFVGGRGGFALGALAAAGGTQAQPWNSAAKYAAAADETEEQGEEEGGTT